MKIGKRAKTFSFTLLEICICLMIVGIAAGFLGVHVKDAIETHRFRNSIAQLKLEMQKFQVLAISHQSDLEVSIYKKKNGFFYKATTEEPKISDYACKENALAGVSRLSVNGLQEAESLQMIVYSSGRIEPLQVIGFHRRDINEDAGSLWLNMKQPLQVKICESYPEK